MNRNWIPAWTKYNELDDQQAALIMQRDVLNSEIKKLQQQKITTLNLLEQEVVHEKV